LCLQIVAAESLVREDVVLISLESDRRESNDSTESVSVPAASLNLLHYYNSFLLYCKGGSRLLVSVIATRP
jgi:hypothetical protein